MFPLLLLLSLVGAASAWTVRDFYSPMTNTLTCMSMMMYIKLFAILLAPVVISCVTFFILYFTVTGRLGIWECDCVCGGLWSVYVPCLSARHHLSCQSGGAHPAGHQGSDPGSKHPNQQGTVEILDFENSITCQLVNVRSSSVETL